MLAAGFEPTPKLLAAKLDVDERDLDEVRQHLESREVSIDPGGTKEGGEETFALAERIAAGRPLAGVRGGACAELADAVRDFVGGFRDGLKDDRERAVWHEHLATEDPVPLGELGTRFGVSKQRMGQIADQLKKRFRTEILDKLGPDVRTDWLRADD